MSELQSPTKSRQISNSLNKLNKAASEGRFRIKSMMRVKTIQAEEQKCVTDRDYQGELAANLFEKSLIQQLYEIRAQESQLKMSNSKYLAFARSMHQRLIDTNTLCLSTCNFQKRSAQKLLKYMCQINKRIIAYDFSQCTYLCEDEVRSSQWILETVIRNDRKIAKLIVKNMSLGVIEIKKLLTLLIETQKIFEFDMSNQNSLSMNRFGDQISLLFDFFRCNPTVGVVSLGNLNLRKAGVDQIQKGISLNTANPLKQLDLKNNWITEQASLQISVIARSGLVDLDLSENPLGPNFFYNIPSWKSSTVRRLNLSSTEMNSECLIFFLSRLQQNKALTNLRLDNNDFSNHWFNRIKQSLEINTSIQQISLAACRIKRLSEMFTGLLHNRYMKRINISNNQFDEGIKQLCELIKNNKLVTEIKMKFCAVKTESFLKIFEALLVNNTILNMDISDNQIGQQGAIQILKTLNSNSSIVQLTLDKSQVPVSIKQQIEKKINVNREIKKSKELTCLQRQTKICRKSDIHSWDDVQSLQSTVKFNLNKIVELESKVSGLDKQYEQKKHRLHQIYKQCNEKERKLIEDVEILLKKMKQLEAEQNAALNKFSKKESELKSAMNQELKSISDLQDKIKQQSTRVQARESELQDHYENYKYMQKKNQSKKQGDKKLGFDNSTAVTSKRKSKII